MPSDSAAREPGAGTGREGGETTPRRPRARGKALLVGLIALAGVAALAAATQVWVEVGLVDGAAAQSRLAVTGQRLNQSLSPVSLALLASALVLTIAGPVLRRVLGVLAVLCGGGIAFVGISVLADPHLEPSSAIAEVTGIVGSAQSELVDSVAVTAWPSAAVAAGLIAAIAGIIVLIVAGTWPGAGRRYETQGPREARETDGGEPDRISDWDALSDGGDPTETSDAG
ncbi:MAG: Trp biosynthesis-associated membrane protein [Leucobacter sp.]|nr:Trp biosynthesis-associated membrane protein [Leucobacter sp.]